MGKLEVYEGIRDGLQEEIKQIISELRKLNSSIIKINRLIKEEKENGTS